MPKDKSVFDECPESSDEEDPTVDSDACDPSEIDQFFNKQFHLASEDAVSLKRNYLLHLAGNSEFDKIAAGGTDKTIYLYDVTARGLTKSTELVTKERDTICGLKFMHQDPNVLFVSSVNGVVSMFDIRSGKEEESFEDNSTGNRKTMTCFDLNQNDRVLCAGTDQIVRDVFLLFFDIRKKSLLGGYWESHTDDLTEIKFHPQNPDLLLSGSVDGLVNVYDISEKEEEDALQFSLNTESSVQRLDWHKADGQDVISCITHTNDLVIFDAAEQDQIAAFKRDAVTQAIKRISAIDCALLNCHNYENSDKFFLLAGSNFNKGECLRSLAVDGGRELKPLTNFVGNKQIVRASVFSQNKNLLITSGESGIVTLWTAGSSSDDSTDDNSLKTNKLKSKKKEKRLKPY